MDLYKSLIKVCKELIVKEPFYGLYLMTLCKHWNNDIQTARIFLNDYNFELQINPDYWIKNEKFHVTILKHELMHICFSHLIDFEDLLKKDQFIANTAMDIEINSYLNNIPNNWITCNTFPHLNLHPGKGTRYYFDVLYNEKNNLLNQYNSDFESISDISKIDFIHYIINNNDTDTILLPSGKQIEIPKHNWNIDYSEQKKKLVKYQFEYITRQIANDVLKSYGTIPGELSDIIKRILEPPSSSVDWRTILKRVSTNSHKTKTKLSYMKLNKLCSQLPGIKTKHLNKILVAVDTSASISYSDLKLFWKELYHISKLSDIEVIQCDAILQTKPEKFDRNKDWKIFGRGGTNYQPIVDFYNKNRFIYNLLLIFTDGYCEIQSKILGNHLWIISNKNTVYNFSHLKPHIIITDGK